MELPEVPTAFNWDPNKESLNVEKHGVNFTEAKQVFNDKNRIIANNPVKGKYETRYYCYGIVKDKVMTVRFTIQADFVRIIGAAYWRKGRKVYESRYKH